MLLPVRVAPVRKIRCSYRIPDAEVEAVERLAPLSEEGAVGGGDDGVGVVGSEAAELVDDAGEGTVDAGRVSGGELLVNQSDPTA